MSDFELIFTITFFVIGAIFGSFGNVVIYRLPKGESVVTPRSRCGSCSTPIAFYDNIPIFSWFLLRGKCRKCGAKYSFRYALVEIITGCLFVGLYLVYGMQWILIEYLIMAFGLVVITFIDLDHFIIPDEFSLGGIVVGLIGAAINPDREFLPALAGVLFGGGALWAAAYIYILIRKEDGMGGGDIKLLGWIGAVLGWTALPFVVGFAGISGAIVGLIAMRTKETGFKTAIPFGPHLAAGAILYMFAGERITDWYLGLLSIP